MKHRFLILALLAFASACFAQNPLSSQGNGLLGNSPTSFSQAYTFTATGTTATINLSASNFNYYRISFVIVGGTLSACQVEVDGDSGLGTFPVTTIVPSTTCTGTGGASINTFNGTQWTPFVRINVSTFTISTGTPTLIVTLSAERTTNLALTLAGSAGQNQFFPIGSNPSNIASNVGSATALGEPGMMNAFTGWGWQYQTATIAASGNSGVLANWFSSGAVASCVFTFNAPNVGTGTTPTLDVYVQSETDGVNWNDMVHFTQATGAVTVRQMGTITNQSTLTAPTTSTDAGLAAATMVQGQLGPLIRFKWVIGGSASPTFTGVNMGMWCHP